MELLLELNNVKKKFSKKGKKDDDDDGDDNVDVDVDDYEQISLWFNKIYYYSINYIN